MAFVQRNGAANSASDNKIAVTLTGVTTGNLIVVGVSWDHGQNGTLGSVTDDQLNAYSVLDQGENVNDQALGTAYAKNVTGGSVTITANFVGGNASFRRIVAGEYSGLDTSSPLDGHDIALSSSGSATPSSPAIVTTADGDTIIGLVEDTQESATVTAGSGFTMRTTSGAYGGLNLEDKVQGTAGSVAADWGFSPSQNYDAAVIAFKAAAVADTGLAWITA